MPELIFVKFGMYIIAPEPYSTAYFIKPAHQSVCMCILLFSLGQRLSNNVITAKNTYATIEELLDPCFFYTVRVI
jgi:hypothetical protein